MFKICIQGRKRENKKAKKRKIKRKARNVKKMNNFEKKDCIGTQYA